MNKPIQFIFFVEEDCTYQNKVRQIMSKLDISFNEISNQNKFFNQLQQKDNADYSIVCISSEQISNSFNSLLKTENFSNSKVFAIYNLNTIKYKEFVLNNFCLDSNLESFEEFLLKNILLNKDDIIPQPQPFLNRLVDCELTKLGILKKYVGFKYLVDFIATSLSYKNENLDTYKIIDLVASINNSSTDTVDHDIRHLLLASWKSCNNLRNALLALNNKPFQPSGKNILKNLILHMKQVI